MVSAPARSDGSRLGVMKRNAASNKARYRFIVSKIIAKKIPSQKTDWGNGLRLLLGRLRLILLLLPLFLVLPLFFVRHNSLLSG